MSLGDFIFGNHVDSAHTYDVDPNKYQYGGKAGGADAATSRYQNMGQGFQDRGQITGNYGAANATLGQNAGDIANLRNAAAGKTASVAEQQMNKGTGDAMKSQMAIAAGARGAGAMGGAQSTAAGNIGAIQGQGIQNAGMLRAQEMATARGQLSQADQAQAAQQADIAGQTANQRIASQGMNDQSQLTAEGMGQRTQEDQLQAQQNQMAQQSQNENNAQQLNAQIGQGNAQSNQSNANFGLGTASSLLSSAAGAAGSLFSDVRAKSHVHDLMSKAHEHAAHAYCYKANAVTSDARAKEQAHPLSETFHNVPELGPSKTSYGKRAVHKAQDIRPLGEDTDHDDREMARTHLAGATGSMLTGAIAHDIVRDKGGPEDGPRPNAVPSSEDIKMDITPLEGGAGGYSYQSPGPNVSAAPDAGLADRLMAAGNAPHNHIDPNDPDLVSMKPGQVYAPENEGMKVLEPGEESKSGGRTSNMGMGLFHDVGKGPAVPTLKMDAQKERIDADKAKSAVKDARVSGAVARMPGPGGGKDEKKSSFDMGKDLGNSLLAAGGKAFGGGGEAGAPAAAGDAETSDARVKSAMREAQGMQDSLPREPSMSHRGYGAGDGDQVKSFLDDLHPYSFKYKDPRIDPTNTGTHYGIMAQDVNRTPMGHSLIDRLPGGYMGIDVKRGIGAALASVAELNSRIESLEGGRRRKV